MNKPDILVRHAKDNVWGEPGQDFNHNINLMRLTPNGGVMSSILYRSLMIYTPTHGKTREWFHIYQVGQLPPVLFDVLPKLDRWTPIIDIIQLQAVMIDVYLSSGGVVPHHHIWLMKDRSKNILVCIKRDRKINFGVDAKVDEYSGVYKNLPIHLDNDRANIRFYANQQMRLNRFKNQSTQPNHPLSVIEKTIRGTNDWSEFLMNVTSIKQRANNQGMAVWYEDGFLVNEPRGFSDDMVNKHYTFIWDQTFKSRVIFGIKGLPSFKSIKDYGARKYLLVTDKVYDTIDFYDDVDFYIVKKVGDNFKGVMVSRMLPTAFRMVSHNTYAIDAELVEYYIQTHEFLGDVNSCSILLNIRQGGMSQGIVNQKNRIEELYQLTYPQVLNAYTQTLSLVPEWNAAQLENSPYTKLISANSEEIDLALVEQAYGYSTCVKAVMNPIQPIVDEKILLPDALSIPHTETRQGNRSIFCYNTEGELVGFYNDNGLDNQTKIRENILGAVKAEVFNMVCDDDCGSWVNVDVASNRLAQYGFSCYVCTEKNGTLYEDWQDVTGNANFYTYTPPTKTTPATITWNWGLLTQSGLYPGVKTNDKMAIWEDVLPKTDFDGCLNIVVKARQYWNNDFLYRPNSLPPAVVDVFVNGLSLIEGVDYLMQWPTIVIVNRWVAKNDSNAIVVRSYGCGNPNSNRPFKPREIGFIKNGMASINGVYDIRNDKPNRVIYNNRLQSMEDMNFGENNTGITLTDGRPYGVLDYIVPIEPYSEARSNAAYLETMDIDNRVSDYLSLYLPENPAPLPRVEKYRWELYSPVICSLIMAIQKGYIADNSTPSNFTNEDAERWSKPFQWMFNYDPAFLKFDENYFHIAPHPFDDSILVTQKQYELLKLINKLYLNDRVNFSKFIMISNPGDFSA